MVMKRWADVCLQGICHESGLGFLYSEVSDSACVVAARLGYNDFDKDTLLTLYSAFSTLALVLNSDGLASVEINCSSNGAIGGYHIRVTQKGEICGYIHNTGCEINQKQFAGLGDTEVFNYFYGSNSKVDIIRYDDKNNKVDAFTLNNVSPWPDVILKLCIQKYMSCPVETIVNSNIANNQNFGHAVVIFNKVGPRANNVFKRVASKDGVDKIVEILSICPSIHAFRIELDLPDLISGPPLTIQPGCTCSEKLVAEKYKSVSDIEFMQIGKLVEETKNSKRYRYEFRCNCCGKLYTLERSFPIEKA